MKAFISVYALIICLAISGILLQTLQTIDSKKDYVIALFFQKQANFYSIALKDMAIKCIKENKTTNNFSVCRDSIIFGPHFSGEYIVKVDKDIIIDISILSPNLLSTHPLNFIRRYIVKI